MSKSVEEKTKWPLGPWGTRVIPVAVGLERTGYAHQVVIGGREHTVAHHDHQNYDHIHHEKLSDGYVRSTGIGRREPDLTPHPIACLISAAPDLYEALRGLVGPTPQIPNAQALIRAHEALAKAEGHL